MMWERGRESPAGSAMEAEAYTPFDLGVVQRLAESEDGNRVVRVGDDLCEH